MNAIENIQKIVGIENVLTGERLDQYEVDPSGKYKGSSLAVVRPENTEQVSEIVKIANEKKIPIVPQGGNTCLLYTSPSPRDATLSRMPSSA